MQNLYHYKTNPKRKSTDATRADRPGRVHAVPTQQDTSSQYSLGDTLVLRRDFLKYGQAEGAG